MSFFFLVLWFAGLAAPAQSTSGSLLGTIADASGAVVPGSTVTATNQATNGSRSTKSDLSGSFAFPSLQPGTYKLSVSATGFSVAESAVDVKLGQGSRVDLRLTPGSTSQTVEVAALGSTDLETEEHQVANVLDTQQLENLPSNGRNLFQNLQSTANVAPFQNAAGPISNFRVTSNSLTIGGSASGTSTYLQDGVRNFSLLTKTANLQPSIESVQEVSLIQSGASARFDQPSVVNVITKAGTNRVHGRVYDYFRNDVLQTRGYFNVAKPPLRYNQFGANVGGPIVHDRLFFLFDYAGLRNNAGTTLFAYVPTDAERQGDFSQGTATIYDPSTYNQSAGTIQPFGQNRIPANRISPFAKTFLGYYPLPTGSVISGFNFQKTAANTTTYNSYLGRVDYNLGPHDQIYGAYASTNPSISNPSFSPNAIFDYLNTQSAKNAYVQHTHTFGANLVNVVRVGYNSGSIFYTTKGTGSQNFVDAFGIANLHPAPSQYAPPAVSLATRTGLGNGASPQGAKQNLYQYSDELSIVHGKHYIYAGGELDQIQMDGNWALNNNGSFNFSGQYTSNHVTGKLAGGSDIGDLLLGFPTSATGATGVTVARFREWNVLPYVQDNWRVTKNLNLNLGVRYDYMGSPSDADGRSNVYDIASNTNHPGTFHQNYKNIAPRIGFAYSLDVNTSVHGGYGIYYSTFQYNQLQFLMLNAPNFYLQQNTYSLSTLTPVTNTFVANPTLSAQAPFTIALNLPTPYIQQRNLVVQHALGHGWTTTIAYLGNTSSHLQIRQNPNQATPPTDPQNPTSLQSRRPYSWVGDVFQIATISRGNYNALETSLDRRFAGGLSFNANYVWSKSLDTVNNGAGTPQYGPDVRPEYGRSDFNPAQVFKFSSVYALPFGTGRRFLTGDNLVERYVIGGWQLSNLLIVQSGLPFNVTASDLSNTGGNHSMRANEICDGNRPQNQSIKQWFNTACYVQPGVGRLGTERRNNILGPRTTNLDLSLFKEFGIRDTARLQFRSDFFNALNHPLLGLPSASVTASTYGQITNITGARSIQFSLKLLF